MVTDFWHGRSWPVLRAKLRHRANPNYWIPKIQANMERDEWTSRELEKLGWSVIRIWEGAVKEDLGTVITEIEAALEATHLPRREGGPTGGAWPRCEG